MSPRFLACLAAACVMTGSAALAAPAGKSRNFDHTVQTVDPIGRFFGFSSSPVGRSTVSYPGNHRPGTVVINTRERRLYLVLGNGQALRYGIGVGRDGFTWSGSQAVTRMAEWPDWTPPEEMILRQPYLPRWMAGGKGNPLGARAIYLGNTMYRIHGTNAPATIGKRVSSGCIRLINADVIDLYSRVKIGTKIIVLPNHSHVAASTQSVRISAPRISGLHASGIY